MHYIVYKITNTINKKTYVGKHQTKNLNDGYMGSGKLLKRAIKKHGKENFIKEILHVFQTEAEMNAKEKELVVLGETSYNLCDGGQGGFGYINSNEEIILKRDKPEYKKMGRIAANKVNAHIKGSNKHQELLRNNVEYKKNWIAKLKAGRHTELRACQICGKQVDVYNFKRHVNTHSLST